ncbi:MAG: hypothetical protein K1X89_00430 [Myxococcaceae bacterium]|nr:hypothetical protein [Myxococcaceae bacterium]
MKSLKVLVAVVVGLLVVHCDGVGALGADGEELSSGQELRVRECLEKLGVFDGGVAKNQGDLGEQMRQCIFTTADGGSSWPGHPHDGGGFGGFDAGLPPLPSFDAGTPPKFDAGLPPLPAFDAGTPPKLDAGAPPVLDAGSAPKPDAGSTVGLGGFMEECLPGCACLGGLRCLNPLQKAICPAKHTFCVP